ncbi:MAG: alpha/beta hydrolase, partial [Solirubrobacterales bacterium]|nr:alpha/beta hydrolase [Solirubrobacterales bacterium]
QGEGAPVILLHGLTATRRYVVMGSRALERSGFRVIAYDARGHGRSAPASAYTYEELTADLEGLLDVLGLRSAVLAGASMGAHTLLSFALRAPERVDGLVVITPSYDPETFEQPERLERWDALARGLRTGGVEGFMSAYGTPRVAERWRETVLKVVAQRMALHEHPQAVADALQAVPRSRPFETVPDLVALADVPVAIVVSDDEPDPEHPRSVGESYAAAIPGAQLIEDEPGSSPTAWQGSRLSRVIENLARQAGPA